MTVATFMPMLSPTSASDKPEVKVQKADFGEGYSQAGHQLNNVRRVVTLKWDVLPDSQAQAIVAFFTALYGTTPFLYTVPGEATATLWTCDDFEKTYAPANWRGVTATLRQSFNIVGP